MMPAPWQRVSIFTMRRIHPRKQSWYGLTCLHFALMISFCGEASAQLRYSIREELQSGTFVGNIAKDLGVDIGTMRDRGFRIVSGNEKQLFQVNQENGALFVNKAVDREELCQKNSQCFITVKAVIENPLEMHHVEVEILDINDNSPSFREKEKRVEIPETAVAGARFQLQGAYDPDVGVNSLRSYTMSANDYFRLETKDRGDDKKTPVLVLQKPLDREQKAQHDLILTALDGGSPQQLGILNITVIVLDINDNAPVFDQEMYTVSLQENSPVGTFVIKVEATDFDEGLNAEVVYHLGNDEESREYKTFEINAQTGEIMVKGVIDFEMCQSYEIEIQASDKGQIPLTVQGSLFIKVEDENDNVPKVEITSSSSVIPENSPLGTVVAIMSIQDLDSGKNGETFCNIEGQMPFVLKPSSRAHVYSLVTNRHLDREATAVYDVKIKAKDLGEPSLSSFKTVTVVVSDENDNTPIFSQNPYFVYLDENNVSGGYVFSVTATDLDEGENAVVSYMLGLDFQDKKITSFLNINSQNGNIYALKSFDFECLKSFQFQVVAKDAGTPSLSSNVTVNVFILDQNDNAPVILFPVSSNGSAVQEIPRNLNAGHLVTKVRAYDRDIGYNGWLSFSLSEITDPSLFGLERYTGQIRTLRPFTEIDDARHKLVVLVKDNGNVSLSATATMIIDVVEAKEAISTSDVKSVGKNEEESNVTLYLIISLGSVSALFTFSIIGLIVMQCSKPTDYSSKYTVDSNYVDTSGNGTLCHSIQYRSGDKRYMLVGPRMSIGSAIENTLVLPDNQRKSAAEVSMQFA